MAEGDNPTGDDLEEMFEGWFADRMEKEKKKADREKPPKNFADALDRIADAVWERGEERAAARKKAGEEGEQPPSTGTKKPGGFLGLLTGTDDG